MAFLIKSQRQAAAGPTSPGQAVVSQWIHVTRATKLMPATTTQQIFLVRGGDVLVKALYMTATVLFDGTDPVLKVSSQALNAAMDTAVGTTTDVASTVSLANLEVGGRAYVEGDGTAIVKSNAGVILGGTNSGTWIAAQGQIYITTGGTNATGFGKWDLFYQPLTEGASVVAVDVATAKI